MSLERSIGNLAIGEYFTIVDTGQSDRSWVGDVLQLVAIDGDLIAVRDIDDPDRSFLMSVSGRTIRRVSNEFVDALKANLGKPTR